jgi:hypothetical protein
MTTFGSHLTRIMYALGDPTEAVWSRTNEVWYWLIEAIREFPILRPMTDDLTFTEDHYNALPSDFVKIVSVEYPIGDDPPTYLTRRSHQSPEFQAGEFYDVVADHDTGSGSLLWIGPVVTSDVRVNYLALHDYAASESMVLTIPDQYLNILTEYCAVRAWEERLSSEIANPTAHASTISQIQVALTQHRALYDRLVKEAVQELGTSRLVPDRAMDKYDRIY